MSKNEILAANNDGGLTRELDSDALDGRNQVFAKDFLKNLAIESVDSLGR